MKKTSLERASRGRGALRRASLLLGTGVFLHAAPAWAVNECGPAPPGGGTVTCPAGEYPNGIDYVTPSNLEIVLQPGVVTRSGSEIRGADVRLLGPDNTLLESITAQSALDVRATGSAFVHLNVIHGSAVVDAAGSITLIADRILSLKTFVGPPAVFLHSTAGSPGQVLARVTAIETTNPFSAGIQVNAPGAGVTLELGSVVTRGRIPDFVPSISSFSPGIRVEAGKVNIDVATVSTRGQLSRGIHVTAQEAQVVSGSVTTTGERSNGIEVLATGNVAITSGRATISGPGSGAIMASSGGNLSIVSEAVEVTGGEFVQFVPFNPFNPSNNVIRADSFGIRAGASGNVVVTSGSVSTTQLNVTGISAGSSDGNVSISAGTVSALRGVGISGGSTFRDVVIQADDVTAAIGIAGNSQTGSVAITVRNLAITVPNGIGISVSAGKGSTTTIRGLVSASLPGQTAVVARFGPATMNIVSGGTLRGRVDLTGSADRVNNSGTFDATGNSAFGEGTDVFDNAAAGIVRATNGGTVFTGLETFSNSGLIEMRDGATDDSLTLPGAYVGAGGARVGLDVDFTAGTADRLITGAATGSTLIDVPGTGEGFISGILVVDAGAGTSPNAFTLAGGIETAYLHRGLRFDAANNDFLLVQLPGQAVFETARFGGMATQLWYESADAVAAQLDTVRDGRRGRGVALWLQGWTGERERSGTQTFAGAGTFDVSFEQDFQGLQGGLDFQAGSAVFGITGGAGRSDAVFVSGNPVDMEVRNVGLYAQGRAGPFFFNALAKRDWAEIEIAPGPGLDAEFDADLFGVQANAGLRIGSGAVYAEPSVGLSWVQADLDSFESGPAAIEPVDADSLRARAGLRVGARLPLGGGDLLPFVAANVYEELGGRNESEFTLGETLRLFDELAGTRGQAAAGVSFVSAGFEAFVRGEMDFSGGADAKAVRAGARLRF